MPHVDRTEHASITADVRAGAEAIRTADLGGATRVYTLGFCFGGRASFAQAAQGHGLDGVIGFYGSVAGPGRAGIPAPVDLVPSFECPVLGLFGGADAGHPAPTRSRPSTPPWPRPAIQHELVTYPGAPHSFFDRTAAEHADAAQDAWRRVLTFVGIPLPS